MPEESESWKLWTEGLDHWRHERLDEAAGCFREAIAKAAAGDAGLVEYHHSLGHVLDELGETSEAQSALEKALELAVERRKDPSSTEIVLARCFLAEHFVRVLRFQQAIEVTEPSVSVGARVEGLLFFVRALAFRGLGQLERARDEADRALQLATSPEQREKFARELDGIARPAPPPLVEG